MSSDGRFYQLAFRDRPVLNGDIGNLLKIEGVVVGGSGAHATLLLPSTSIMDAAEILASPILALTGEEWTEYLRRSDDPEILVGPVKAFHRKLRYEISGLTQQKIWRADDFKCQYCERPIGDVQLTIDHFLPLELGGLNEVANYLSACRKCNKDKGSTHPKEWCDPQQYLELGHYLQHRIVR